MGIYSVQVIEENIDEPKDLNYFDLGAVAYFFGTACFAMEGNTVILNVRRSMMHPEKFSMVLFIVLTFYTGLLITISNLGYFVSFFLFFKFCSIAKANHSFINLGLWRRH